MGVCLAPNSLYPHRHKGNGVLAWEDSSLPRRTRKSITRIEVKSALGEEAAQEAGLKQEDLLERSTPSQSSGMTKYQEGGEKRGRDTVSQE